MIWAITQDGGDEYTYNLFPTRRTMGRYLAVTHFERVFYETVDRDGALRRIALVQQTAHELFNLLPALAPADLPRRQETVAHVYGQARKLINQLEDLT